MNADAIAKAEAEVKRLSKRVQYWHGRVTAELNKHARDTKLKAEQPQSDAAYFITEVTLSNYLVMADNYDAVAQSEAASLRRAEEALTALLLKGAPK